MIKKELQKLLFIYNANSGMRNTLLDGAHKIISPKTYQCNLCDITYGAFTENKVWKGFRTESTLAMEFLHKDEFQEQYASKFGHSYNFPIVLGITASGMEVIVTPDELNMLGQAGDLIQLIKERS